MTEEFLKVYRDMFELSHIAADLKYRNVLISEKDYIHEVYTVSNQKLPHVVCLHGFGATSMAFLKMF